jgi:chaperonin GroES
MFEKFRPLFDRVLVQRLDDIAEKTVGGIIIPDAAKEKAQIGKVLAVGPGRMTPEGKTIPCSVKVGDKVFFSKYAGTEAEQELLVIREDEILGIIE